MAEPIAVLVTTIIGLGSAIGGYLAKGKTNSISGVCLLHSTVLERLVSGQEKFEQISTKLDTQSNILSRIEERVDGLRRDLEKRERRENGLSEIR